MANPIGVQGGGNILPATIVVMQGGANSFQVVQATGATTQLFGIADEALMNPPNINNNIYAAIAGFPFRVFQLGEEANVYIGSPVNAGDWITSDANGRGITATTGQNSVGQALEQGTASLQLVRVAINPAVKS